jgi:hypothetical protein
MTVHNLTLYRWGEAMPFASLDGEDWLPVSRPARPGDEEALRQLFDGDGNFRPMKFARRFFELQPDDAKIEWEEPADA